MFEIITAILEPIIKLINPTEIEKHIKENKLRDIGTKLFLLYIRLNEILVCGEAIVNSLDEYVQRMERHLPSGDENFSLKVRKLIALRLVEQRLNIVKFGKAAQELSNELQIIDDKVYLELRPLLIGKRNALDSLINELAIGNLPLDTSADTFLQGSIQTDIEWDENVYKKIKEYTKKQQPHKQLEKIRKIAEQLRESLTKYFSITDILLEVGDKRFQSRNSLW